MDIEKGFNKFFDNFLKMYPIDKNAVLTIKHWNFRIQEVKYKISDEKIEN